MSGPSRRVPVVAMPVIVVHLAAEEDAVVEEVRDDGRTLIVQGEPYRLSPLTATWVHADDPYYGRRLRFPPPP